MNLKSLLVSFALVAATSTAALAKPATFTVEAEASFSIGGSSVRDHRDDRVTVRDHRDGRMTVRDHRSWFRPRIPATEPAPIFTSNTKIIRSSGYVWSEYTGPVYSTSVDGRGGFVAVTDATRIGQIKQDFWMKGMRAQTIQIRPIAGSTMITQVAIEFGPGSKTQVVRVNRDLRNGAITIDLEGHTRSVSRIAVYGSSGASSAYQILAR